MTEVYTSPGILDLSKFKVDLQVAAWAVEYLISIRPSALHYQQRGEQEWYIGMGGRAVVLTPGREPQLKSFRRFEYSILAKNRAKAIDVEETLERFRRRAARKGEAVCE